ncbi:MAG: hypothetical protein WBV46_03245 [Terriglobales bacterium]|jgi:hypothetical protein
MHAQKATYWVALALAAFGFNSAYQQGAFPTLHRLSACAGSRVARLGIDAERTVAMARLTIGRSSFSPLPSLPSLAPLPVGHLPASFGSAQLADARTLAHEHARMARELAQDRVEMIRDQARAEAEIMRAQVRLQETELRHAGKLVRMNPQIHLSDAMPAISIEPASCAKSIVRVSLAGAPDDDADSR